MGSRFLCFLSFSLFLLYAGEQSFWEKQAAADWTPQQVAQFTNASPWAKQVTAVLVSNDSNMAENPRSPGEYRTRSSRPGPQAPSPSALPKWEAVVRWVSAKPMRQALKLRLPESLQGRYVIAVSGLPIGADNTAIAEQTTLQSKRGAVVHPESAYQDPVNTSTIYFAFLPSMLDLSAGKTVVFNMLAPPYAIQAKFKVAAMKYLGQPAL